MTPTRLGSSLVVLLALPALSGAIVQRFEDGTFTPGTAPGAWELIEVDSQIPGACAGPPPSCAAATTVGACGCVTVTQETTGGNPGAYRTIQTILGPTTDYGQVTSFHRLVGATWDPSTGPFASLDYSEDSILIEPPGAAQGMATGPALRQNDSIYIRPGFFTPEPTWTHRAAFGVTADQFNLLQGCCNAHPDFSASGSTIEFGFFRANSAAPGVAGGGGTAKGGIDNFRIVLNLPCADPSQCDDEDACTTDACSAGFCAHAGRDCGDGDPCTTDGCSAGTCQHTPLDCTDRFDCTADTCVNGVCENPFSASFDLVERKINELRTLLRGPCGDAPLARKLRRKLDKALKKARARLVSADRAAREALIGKLIGRADRLVASAETMIALAYRGGQISLACYSSLRGFLDELLTCTDGLPRS